MNLEQKYKDLKLSIESKKNEKLQLQADINSINSQLADLQKEAQSLGVSDLTQLDTIISQKEAELTSKLTALEQSLQSIPDCTPVQSTSIQSTPVQSIPDIDMSTFGDFGL